jgi:toxin YoeB
MQTVIKIKASELNQSFIKKVKDFIKGREDADITVTINAEDYYSELKKSINDIDSNNNLVSFTLEEFEDFRPNKTKWGISFSPPTFNEYNEWASDNKQIYNRISEMIKEISREPFKGKGKPEPIKGEFKGYWSRRINDEHRLIYRADDTSVYIAKCKGHYSDKLLMPW